MALANRKSAMFLFLTLCTLPLPIEKTPPAAEQTTNTCSYFQKMPELLFLKGTESSLPKEENLSQECVEWGQILLSLRCFEWIIEGSDRSYEAMTHGQPASFCLQKENFLALHRLSLQILQGHPKLSKATMQSLFEKALLLQGLEKSEKFRASFGINASDSFPKAFLSACRQKPTLFPSFSLFSEEESEFFSASAHFGNFGPIFYLEGGKEMFRSIKEKLSSQKNGCLSFDFSLLVYLCTLAGGLAHFDTSSSLALTEEAYLAFQTTRESCRLLLLPKKQEEDAYFYCIEKRTNQLHLELKKSSDYSFVRIAALLRLFSPHEGALLKEAFHGLSYAQRESILLQFQEKKALQAAPTCLSHFLMNVFNSPSSGSTTKEKLKNTVGLALPLLAQILKDAYERVELGLLDPKISLDFQKASQFANEHPLDLNQAAYQIDKEGRVTLFFSPESRKP